MNNNAMMITKVKNIYIMLLHAISKENIDMVDLYLDDKLTEHFKKLVANNIKNNIKEVFRQPNISDVYIINEDNEYITFETKIRYINYQVNRTTNKHVSGDNKTRISNIVHLTFRKNNTTSKALYKCPNCGVSLKINAGGVCSYCDSVIDERFSPFVLCSIRTI